ncbi:MmcQ/YjbR family DNA-binding protein [Paenibacillus mesophilus]|uniref:MmcQ/YjbR family DNA-binding protein n=1 Tax=Paenibacillus mesophilus TaxID=2582849 RepID=UPI00110E1988|nr:MmcQ/YjbR family DNA-binding protein [Paenibacillus mesophilus]TMV49626.1 MmcQ/YjbR family DNA-binding protein [Paenibacillus mesophilus]
MVTSDDVHRTALSLPGAEERDHSGKPSFRVGNKVFAVIQPDGVSLVLKTTKEDRHAYTTMAPDIYAMPDSFASMAYMVVRMDRIDPSECREMIVQAWRLVSPKRAVAAYDRGSI